MATTHRGHIYHIAGAPLVTQAAEHLAVFPDGALVVDDEGIIQWCGDWTALPEEHAGADVVDHHGAFILPGFVDTHMHFPQVWCGDSYGGGQLLEWLDYCIFPSESKLEDPEYARIAAVEWIDRMVTAGTIEERIQTLKASKKDLFDKLIGGLGGDFDLSQHFTSLRSLVTLTAHAEPEAEPEPYTID